MNIGKIFEQEIKASVPKDIFFYRFKDGTASWGKSDGVRFQSHNICDCFLCDGKQLYFLELKSHKGKSLPLSCIRPKQQEELLKASVFTGITAGYLINFRDVGRTFYVDARRIENHINFEEKKSISIKDCENYGIEIKGTKKRTRYVWNIKDLLE